ncbi:hypothetical protein INT43_008310 [Umbelopsis isabellina]|uniref:Rhodanese domain-containing protein n=1 Tax=Mortierella isabellina TaxID=91625 RepID=A0A8H7PCW4_MORIS|nr:hypothetical protein INT43_008310 [Umbelopsis isabellina]
MQRVCRAWVAPYLSHSPKLAWKRPHSNSINSIVGFRYWSTRAAEPYRPVAFYSLRPWPQSTVSRLQSRIKDQLQRFNVVGRIYLASDRGIGGINAQLCVPVCHIEAVQTFFDTLPEFKGATLEYNHGMEDTDQPIFQRLKIMQKPNLVAVPDTLKADILSKAPKHLTPEQWHRDLSTCSNDTLLIDMRNHYEYDVGRFNNATRMNVDTFRESLEVLDELVKGKDRNEAIYMYCTGGIRCSVAGAYISDKGYSNVNMVSIVNIPTPSRRDRLILLFFQLKGGITNYGHFVRNNKVKDSLFRGSNFTFDGRRGERITDDVLAHCHQCGAPCDVLSNCANNFCHLLFIQCPACQKKHEKLCSSECRDVVNGHKEWNHPYDYRSQIRPPLRQKL